VLFKAVYQNTTVGAHIWYTQGDIAYSHLAAFSPLGYNLMASYALYWHAIEYFADDRVHRLDIGAGAGHEGSDADGLSWFKRGWSTETRTAYFCGRIFDHARYASILKTKEIPETDYFPAYRLGEFG
jgi:lipid II:glycine glycyltransferase (peptidoglycan interpeptide bridge formation enzyme)